MSVLCYNTQMMTVTMMRAEVKLKVKLGKTRKVTTQLL